jgi:flagellar basal body-associated protein FliL
MTSAMTTTLDHTPSWPRALRLLLLALALVVLLAASFAIGHVTGSSHQGPATSPTQIQAPATANTETGSYCQVGHLRGPC